MKIWVPSLGSVSGLRMWQLPCAEGAALKKKKKKRKEKKNDTSWKIRPQNNEKQKYFILTSMECSVNCKIHNIHWIFFREKYVLYITLNNFFFFLGPRPRHVKVPRLEVESSYSCRLRPQPHRIQALSSTYTIAHGNARSLAHWARPGIKPTSSWILVRFISAAPWWELLNYFHY